jgi:hypothetical protein
MIKNSFVVDELHDSIDRENREKGFSNYINVQPQGDLLAASGPGLSYQLEVLGGTLLWES